MDINLMFTLGLEALLFVAAIALALPIWVLFIECVAASLLPLPREFEAGSANILQNSDSMVVLVPAHNEAEGIAAVLKGIQCQLRSQDRVLVVADNCTDKTAAIARETGAHVLERWDPQHRGKGYALDFGLNALCDNPPAVVVLMDADCKVTSGSLQHLAARSLNSGRPAQATYLFKVPPSASSKALISAFAIKVKNWVRPLGLLQLGLPSLLFGTGMAFPWSVMRSVDIASGHIVEDMKLGFDLAIAGHPPLLCPEVQVEGQLPETQSATTSQRTRWEHGHLQVLRTYLPRLLWQGIRQQRFDLLALALDLSIPPLSLLVILWLVSIFVSILVALVGLGWSLTVLLGISGGGLLIAIGIAWFRFARADISLYRLVSIVFYLVWKVPLYARFIVKPQSKWIRTERTKGEQTTQG